MLFPFVAQLEVVAIFSTKMLHSSTKWDFLYENK